MGKLSELVKPDYDAEVEIIREAGGSLWPRWIGLAARGDLLGREIGPAASALPK